MRITGVGRLADFRERLRWLMVRDADAEDYTEHHHEGLLEYRFEPKKGIPFPAFAEASSDFPELRVEAQWERNGQRGRAVIESGRVLPGDEIAPELPGIDVSVGEDGELLLALTLKEAGGSWAGYAVSAARHTYFRHADGELSLVDPDAFDQTLEDIAIAFVEEWIWFDEEAAAVERARYADYRFPVRGANLKSEKLALLRRQEGGRYCTLDPAAIRVREALVAKWLNPA